MEYKMELQYIRIRRRGGKGPPAPVVTTCKLYTRMLSPQAKYAIPFTRSARKS